MKNQKISSFLLLCIVFFCFCTGLFFGRNFPKSPPAVLKPDFLLTPANACIDLNQADTQELMTLPGIGQTLARRILDYRDVHGSFTSLVELLNIDGIGQARLEALLPYITLGG